MKIQLTTPLLILLCVSVIASSCEHSLPENLPAAANEQPSPLLLAGGGATDCLATRDEPFVCVERACEKVGGIYDNGRRRCECADGGVFSAALGGHCLRTNGQVGIEDFAEFESSLSSNRASYLPLLEIEGVTTPYNKTLLSGVLVVAGELSEEELRLMQPEYEALLSAGNVVLPSLPADVFQMRFVLGDGKAREALLGNLILRDIPLAHAPGLANGYFRNYWTPDLGDWEAILRGETRTVTLRKAPNFGSEAKAEIWRVIEEDLQMGYQSIEHPKVILYTADGCAGHCLIESSRRNGQFEIVESVEYVSGVPIRHQFIVEDRKASIFRSRHAVVEIDPTNSPSVVYLIETDIEPASGDLVQNIQVYSPDAKLLLSKRELLVSKFHNVTLNRDRGGATGDQPSSVVLCEEGLLPSNEKSSEFARFRFGPGTDISFWGWLNDHRGPRLQLQLSGLKSLNAVNAPIADTINLNRHASSVAHIITKDSDLSVISIGAEQCLTGYESWKKTVRKFARVVNFSATSYFDERACLEDPNVRAAMADDEKPFLWIASSGNSGFRDLNQGVAKRCPQSLGPRPNLLVVGAIQQGSDYLADYSNSGRYYADIAADGAGYYPKEAGTSFSTPRVSRVAALIGEEFPSLSIEQLRAALLLGARIPYSDRGGWLSGPQIVARFLETRSGGILDEDAARKIVAHMISEGIFGTITYETADRILEQMNCSSNEKSQECQLARQRSSWIKETKLFEYDAVKLAR